VQPQSGQSQDHSQRVALADGVGAGEEVREPDDPDAADEQEEGSGDEKDQREDLEHVHLSQASASSSDGITKYLAIARFPMKFKIA